VLISFKHSLSILLSIHSKYTGLKTKTCDTAVTNPRNSHVKPLQLLKTTILSSGSICDCPTTIQDIHRNKILLLCPGVGWKHFKSYSVSGGRIRAIPVFFLRWVGWNIGAVYVYHPPPSSF
jgi:hypothetical protein